MTETICGIEGCKRQGKKRGWCAMHYERWLRHGDPSFRKRVVMIGSSEIERFTARVEKSSGCWMWTGAKTSAGYGNFTTADSRNVLAHRYSFEQEHGPIKDGAIILHECDTPACVNPNHLRAGTQSDNMQDMVDKGRHLLHKVKR